MNDIYADEIFQYVVCAVNEISDEGAKAIGKGLTENTTLTLLELEGIYYDVTMNDDSCRFIFSSCLDSQSYW